MTNWAWGHHFSLIVCEVNKAANILWAHFYLNSWEWIKFPPDGYYCLAFKCVAVQPDSSLSRILSWKVWLFSTDNKITVNPIFEIIIYWVIFSRILFLLHQMYRKLWKKNLIIKKSSNPTALFKVKVNNKWILGLNYFQTKMAEICWSCSNKLFYGGMKVFFSLSDNLFPTSESR